MLDGQMDVQMEGYFSPARQKLHFEPCRAVDVDLRQLESPANKTRFEVFVGDMSEDAMPSRTATE